jgi:RNA polymerase sigma factor (sigma-70 family)
MSAPDRELVRRTLAGDAGAFTALVEKHQRLVFGVALSSARDAAIAEDVAQEAFVEAWRDLGRLRDPSRVGSWIAGIARNLARGISRTSRRRRAIDDAKDDAAPAAAPTPLDQVIEAESHGLVREALTEIPAAYREVLVLFYVHGQSIEEVAGALGVREDLVKQRLVRGRKALRATMEARVERALSAMRPSKAFTATVIAAISTAATREAAAAGAAGKLFMGVSKVKLVFVGAAVVVASGVGYVAWRERATAGSSIPPATASAVASGPPGRTPAPTSAAPVASIVPKHPVARRFDNPAARERLLQQVQHRRTAARPPSPAFGGAAGDAPDEDLDKEYVRDAVHAIEPLLTECYTAALDRDPSLAGRIEVQFTIEGDPDIGGLVTESAIDPTSEIKDPAFRECVQETMFAIEIDPPRDGGKVGVTYPFEFRSTPTP